MELNREQIIKALECCASEGFQDCENCPLNIPHQPCSKVKLPRISLALIKELTEENERLRADTVRKFAERLNANFKKYERSNWAVRAIIDKTKEELCEGKNEPG